MNPSPSLEGVFLPATEPRAAFEVRHREHRKGARWRKVGTAVTRAEAVALVVGSGDWQVIERRVDSHFSRVSE